MKYKFKEPKETVVQKIFDYPNADKSKSVYSQYIALFRHFTLFAVIATLLLCSTIYILNQAR